MSCVALHKADRRANLVRYHADRSAAFQASLAAAG